MIIGPAGFNHTFKENSYKPEEDLRAKSLLQHALHQATLQKYQSIERVILAFAEPPIKGEITEGKLRWRGIKIVEASNGECWVEQRGKRIGPKIVSNFVARDAEEPW